MRNYQRFIVNGEKNSLHEWINAAGFWRTVRNFTIITFCRYLPFFSWKNYLYRRLGMRVERNAAVGLMVMFDVFFPEEITIGENSILGYNTTVLAHEFLVNEWHKGKVEIGKNVLIGANSTILAGVKIGDGAIVSACSLVNRDVLPGTMVGGVPIREIRQAGEESWVQQATVIS